MNSELIQLKEEEKEAFISSYDVVFVDSTGLINLTSRVTKNAWDDVIVTNNYTHYCS
jgi:hypothetical protein